MTEFRAGFEAELAAQGYTELSGAQQVRLLARVSDWLASRGLEAAEFDQAAAEEFLAARQRAGYTHCRSPIGMAPMLNYLRSTGAIPVPVPVMDSTPAGRLIESYELYLVRERGLVASTVGFYVGIARRFLDAHASAERLELDAVTPAHVGAFVVAECARRSARSGVVTALRCLLRYLFLEGLVATELAWAVPSAAGWRGASLPRDVPVAQLCALLASCDRRRATGRRDFALITVISRLGLRAGEAAALSVDDIDWRSGDLTIKGKGRRYERLPLPDDVGEAIVAYLVKGRPTSTSRNIFIRAIAPCRELTATAVTMIVYRACKRAGVPAVGAHRLRHTAATQMLRRGASLGEVAQVLRHHDLLTTSTYAKVDRAVLATLAQPWPGIAR